MPEIIWTAPSGRRYSVPYEGEPSDDQINEVFAMFDKAEAKALKSDAPKQAAPAPAPVKAPAPPAPAPLKAKSASEVVSNLQKPIAPATKKIDRSLPEHLQQYANMTPEQKREKVMSELKLDPGNVSDAVKLGWSRFKTVDGREVSKTAVMKRLALIGAAPLQASRDLDTFGDEASQRVYATDFGKKPMPQTRESAVMGQGKALTHGRKSVQRGVDKAMTTLADLVGAYNSKALIAQGQDKDKVYAAGSMVTQSAMAAATGGLYAINASTRATQSAQLVMSAVDMAYLHPAAMTMVDPNAPAEEKWGAAGMFGLMFGVPVAGKILGKGLSKIDAVRNRLSVARDFDITAAQAQSFIDAIQSGDKRNVKSVIKTFDIQAQAKINQRIRMWLETPEALHTTLRSYITDAGIESKRILEPQENLYNRDAMAYEGMAEKPYPWDAQSVGRLKETIDSVKRDIDALESSTKTKKGTPRKRVPSETTAKIDELRTRQAELETTLRDAEYTASERRVKDMGEGDLLAMLEEPAASPRNKLEPKITEPFDPTTPNMARINDDFQPKEVISGEKAKAEEVPVGAAESRVLDAMKPKSSTTGFTQSELIELSPALNRVVRMFDGFKLVNGVIHLVRKDGTVIMIGKNAGLPVPAGSPKNARVEGMTTNYAGSGRLPDRWKYIVTKDGQTIEGDLSQLIDLVNTGTGNNRLWHELYHASENMQVLDPRFYKDVEDYYSTERGINDLVEGYQKQGMSVSRETFLNVDPDPALARRERAAMGFDLFQKGRDNAGIWEKASQRMIEFAQAVAGWVRRNDELQLLARSQKVFRKLETRKAWNGQRRLPESPETLSLRERGTILEGEKAASPVSRSVSETLDEMKATGYYNDPDVEIQLIEGRSSRDNGSVQTYTLATKRNGRISNEVIITFDDLAQNYGGKIVKNDWMQIRVSAVLEDVRGKGAGIDSYEKVIEFARAKGKKAVARDWYGNSIDAQVVWCALANRGYKPLMVDRNGVPIAVSTTKTAPLSHDLPHKLKTAILYNEFKSQYMRAVGKGWMTPDERAVMRSIYDNAKSYVDAFVKVGDDANHWSSGTLHTSDFFNKQKNDPNAKVVAVIQEALDHLKEGNSKVAYEPAKSPWDSPALGFEAEQVAPFAVNNEAIRRELERMGKSGLDSSGRASQDLMRAMAKEWDLTERAKRIVDRILSESGSEYARSRRRQLTGEEAFALEARFYDLQKRKEDLLAKMKLDSKLNFDIELGDINIQLERLYRAIHVSGYEWHKSGVARQWSKDFEYTTPGMKARYEAVVNREATPDEIEHMEKMAEAMKLEGFAHDIFQGTIDDLAEMMRQIDEFVKSAKAKGKSRILRQARQTSPAPTQEPVLRVQTPVEEVSAPAAPSEPSAPKTPSDAVPEGSRFTRKGDDLTWTDAEGTERTVKVSEDPRPDIRQRAKEIDEAKRKLEDKLAATILRRQSLERKPMTTVEEATHKGLKEAEKEINAKIAALDSEVENLVDIATYVAVQREAKDSAEGMYALSGYHMTDDEIKSVKTTMDILINAGNTLDEALTRTRDMMYGANSSVTTDDIGNAWVYNSQRARTPATLTDRIKRAYQAETKARMLLEGLRNGTIDPATIRAQRAANKARLAQTSVDLIHSRERLRMYKQAIDQWVGVYTPEREYSLEKLRAFMREMALTDLMARIGDLAGNTVNLGFEGGVIRPLAKVHDWLLHPLENARGRHAFGKVLSPGATVRNMHGSTMPFTKQFNQIFSKGDPYLSSKIDVMGKPGPFSRLTALTDFMARDTMFNMVSEEVSHIPGITVQEMHDIAFAEAERLVYMNANEASKLMQSLLGRVRSEHGGRWHGFTGLAVDILLGRFPKVVTNILVRSIDYLPVAGHTKTLLSHAFRSPKVKEFSVAERRVLAEAFARNNVGVALAFLGAKLYDWGALDPLIIAENPDKGRIDFHPVFNWLPGATQALLFGARIKMILNKSTTEKARKTAIGTAYLDSLTSTSWTSGMREVMEVITNPSTFPTYVGEAAGRQTPQLTRSLSRWQDLLMNEEISRSKRGLAEGFMGYVPDLGFNPTYNRQYLAPATPGHDLITRTVRIVSPDIRYVYKRPPRDPEETLDDYKRRLAYVETCTAYHLEWMMRAGVELTTENKVRTAIKEITGEYSKAYRDMMERKPKPIDEGRTVKNLLFDTVSKNMDDQLSKMNKLSDTIKARGAELRKADLGLVNK